MSKRTYSKVSTKPVKRFFVEMLTRDISVEDAILDLLDNCIDGILRYAPSQPDENTPYTGYWAKITVNEKRFEITDNCGGIPWSEHERTFRMGRLATEPSQSTEEVPLGVGAYGIGMKRAIFKIGTEALIWTQNDVDNYQVPISAAWMKDEQAWDLKVNRSKVKMEKDGTHIAVTTLNPGIQERFADGAFETDLIQKIQNHYAVIIQKGFVVTVNTKVVTPTPILFRFADKSGATEVRPYIFQSKANDVDIFLAIGLRDPIPGIEHILEEQNTVQFSSNYAGWTIICNDRVVLYCNRDELTGWGTAGIPRYHTQFIAISGVVEFRGDPRKLPTTTTKRGLDFSSALYQQVLDRMREGLRMFVDFTNNWKTREDEAKIQVSPVPAINYSSLRQQAEQLTYATVRVGLEGRQYKPRLPEPENNATDVRISYSHEKDAVLQLAEQLLPDVVALREKDIPRKVGEASFNYAYHQLVEVNNPESTN